MEAVEAMTVRLRREGVAVAGVVIAMEHVLLSTGGAPRFARHFTLLNGIVSVVLGMAGILSLAIAHG